MTENAPWPSIAGSLDRTREPWVRAQQAVAWLGSTVGMVERLADRDRSRPVPGLLAQRLLGVLKDIGTSFRSDEHRPWTDEDAALVEKVRLIDEQIRASSAKILGLLAREDLIALEYIRDCQTHVFQDHYVTKPAKTLQEVGRVTMEAFNRVMDQLDGREDEFLERVAMKMLEPMREMFAAFLILRLTMVPLQAAHVPRPRGA